MTTYFGWLSNGSEHCENFRNSCFKWFNSFSLLTTQASISYNLKKKLIMKNVQNENFFSHHLYHYINKLMIFFFLIIYKPHLNCWWVPEICTVPVVFYTVKECTPPEKGFWWNKSPSQYLILKFRPRIHSTDCWYLLKTVWIYHG